MSMPRVCLRSLALLGLLLGCSDASDDAGAAGGAAGSPTAGASGVGASSGSSGQAGSGEAGSSAGGQAGSAQAGSDGGGQAGSAQAGSGGAQAGSGQAGGGQAGGEAGAGVSGSSGQAGEAGAGGVAGSGAGGSDAGAGGAGAGAGGVVAGCQAQAGPLSDSTQTLTVGGLERNFLVHLPPGYQPGTPAPLALVFHGYLQSAADIRGISKMDAEADQRGFIVVYGTGTDTSWNAGVCCGQSVSKGVDDVAFAKAILDRMEQLYCIDPRREYAAGLSNGGLMSHRLACEVSERFAAIGPVAGTIALPLCNPKRAVSVIAFHGTADAVVSYGTDGFQGTKSAPATDADWAQRDGCTGSPQQVYQQGDTTCMEHTTCNEGTAVRLCTIEGGGHQWPGGNEIPFLGKVSTDVNASGMILDFFLAHPLP